LIYCMINSCIRPITSPGLSPAPEKQSRQYSIVYSDYVLLHHTHANTLIRHLNTDYN
ncbi:hypothetical protein GOODEAATRI_004326, partial [Goodea atripinnis]